MITVDEQNREISLNFGGCAEEIVDIQRGLLNALQMFDFDNHALSAESAFYSITRLLEAMLPDVDQMKRAFVKDTDYLELPNKITPQQKQLLKDAFLTIQTGTTVSSNNPLLQALNSIKG